MDKQQVSKLRRGDLVMFTTSRSRKYAYTQPALFMGAGPVLVKGRSYPYSHKEVSGATVMPIVGNGTPEHPFTMAEEAVSVPNSGIRSVLCKAVDSGVFGGKLAVDFCTELREWKVAEEKARTAQAVADREAKAAVIQAQVEWVRSFGLTVRTDLHYHMRDLVEHDGWNSDVTLDGNGKVTIPFDLLVGLVQGPAE